MKKILITGGAGFIGSHLTKHFVKQYPENEIYCLDSLTYAGDLENLREIIKYQNFKFIQADITSQEKIDSLFIEHGFTSVIHLAAESHVDRSIQDPLIFVKTNVVGTAVLLNASREKMKTGFDVFYHVSTDEVYGSLEKEGFFTEKTPYDPRSPYSASKASSDHLVRAYYHTYDLPIVISNCSNNYGSHQHFEKLIPLTIRKIYEKQPIPVYGKGENIRDWLWVEDHVRAIDVIFHKGRKGETYNIGGFNEWKNIDVVKLICEIMDLKLDRESGKNIELIRFVEDRLGHDLRYAIDASKLNIELGWSPSLQFREGIEKTIDWYLQKIREENL